MLVHFMHQGEKVGHANLSADEMPNVGDDVFIILTDTKGKEGATMASGKVASITRQFDAYGDMPWRVFPKVTRIHLAYLLKGLYTGE